MKKILMCSFVSLIVAGFKIYSSANGNIPPPIPQQKTTPTTYPTPSPNPDALITSIIHDRIKPIYESNISSETKCVRIREIMEKEIVPLTEATSFQINEVLRSTCPECFLFEQEMDCPWEVPVSTIIPPAQYVTETFQWEAESGTITAPMVSAAGMIYTTVPNSGTADFPFVARSTGPYVMWGKILSPDDSHDSFFVSIDTGTEDIYDTADNTWSPNLQWTVVGGRGGTPTSNFITPRLFSLETGSHILHVRGREASTKMDKLTLTNQISYDPRL